LDRLAHGLRASSVVTGHTRDDSIETVLMHLLRGSGGRGLSGIGSQEILTRDHTGSKRPDRRGLAIWLVRPMLGVSRAETSAYCQARGIRWLIDPTNADSRILRNRVRHHLLPVLRTYNPAIDDALDRLSVLMRDDETFLDSLAFRQFGIEPKGCFFDRLYKDKLLDGTIRLETYGYSVEVFDWELIGTALQRRVIRQMALHLGADVLGFDAVERALAVGREDGPRRADMNGNLTVERYRGRLHMVMRGQTIRGE
jgi:tRNA(Ile)-lysidine synthase